MIGRKEPMRAIRCVAIWKGSKIVRATTIAFELIHLKYAFRHTCSRACCVGRSPESPSWRLQILCPVFFFAIKLEIARRYPEQGCISAAVNAGSYR